MPDDTIMRMNCSNIKEVGSFVSAQHVTRRHIHNEPGGGMRYLANKVQYGVDFLISQMFFDNDAFYKFIDRPKQPYTPVLAGIM